MAKITIVKGGICHCGHKQKHHMDNKGCKKCDCIAIGTY